MARYTLGDFKRIIGARIVDKDWGDIDETHATDEINSAIRKIAKKMELCRATITFTIANPTASGSITSHTENTILGITYYNMSGIPTYIIENGIRLLEVARHISSFDGSKTDLHPATRNIIDNLNLIGSGRTKFTHFRVIESNDLRMQFLPLVSESSYPHGIELAFSFIPQTLTLDTDISQLPESHQDLVIPYVAQILENTKGRPERIVSNREEYIEELGDARNDQQRTGKHKPTAIAKTYFLPS